MSMALLDAIGYVDDEFIDEAERELPQSSTRHIRWLPAAACAAVCAVMVWALGTRSVPEMEMGPGGADEQAWEESTVIEKVPVQTEKTQEISTESLSAGYCVTIRIEAEKDGIITGTVTAVKGLESIGVGDRIQVDRTKECKSYNYDQIGPEPMFAFTESEGTRYLQIQSEEWEVAERYVELLP